MALLVLGREAVFRIIFSAHRRKAVAVVSGEVVVDFLEFTLILFSRFFQMGERCIQHFAARQLFLLVVLIFRTARNPENAYHEWKRESLQDQGHKDNAEGEKDYQVALREGVAIGERFRKSDR